MAGDWIKMRIDLGDDPAVIGMASILGIDEDVIVGKLHRLWSWADKHTIDGKTNGVTPAWLDRFVACKGFADAMQSAKWLLIDGGSLCFPNFDKHNGKSAKSRAEAAIRQRLSRENRDKGERGHDRVVTPAPFVRAVVSRDGGRCAYCGDEGSRHNKLGVDHIIPMSRGGKDAMENLVSCCSLCNREKNDRTPEEWGMPLKFLPQGVTYESHQICDRTVTRVEKKRITTPIPPSGAFLRFWGTWPKSNRKQAQGQCWDRWRKADMDLCADAIISHVEGLKGSADWRKNGGEFVPAPLVYLNQRRWEGAEAPAAVQEAPLYRREGVM
jgi:5-methylcytosine-specific restriction endonuclease McrA